MIIMGLLKPEKQEESGLKFTENTLQLSHRERLAHTKSRLQNFSSFLSCDLASSFKSLNLLVFTPFFGKIYQVLCAFFAYLQSSFSISKCGLKFRTMRCEDSGAVMTQRQFW